MKTGLIVVGTFLFIIGLFLLAVRFFVSLQIPDLGFANMDVVVIFIPAILIIFGIILFILGTKKTDVHIEQEAVSSGRRRPSAGFRCATDDGRPISRAT